jgi:hypothetical protein
MRCVRALPIHPLMPAARSSHDPVAIALLVDFPERLSGRTLRQPARRAPHPSSCRRTSSVDPDKAGRRHAQRSQSSVHGRPQMA